MAYKKWLRGSAYTVRLPKGCVHCARGGKLVLLVTGKCTSGCYYCPLSLKKKGEAVVYADELRVRRDEDILDEAKLIDATGTGVTGGDPLIQPVETARLIKILKSRFGEKHHVHLYTSSANTKGIAAVAAAGLDEIRLHPPVDEWGKIRKGRYRKAADFARDLGMEVGLEIPAIPGKEREVNCLLELASELDLSFVNLNELEFSESNWQALRVRGFDVKDDISSAAKGSERMALRLLADSPSGLPVHYCSSSFKDAVQLRRRIARRARNIKRSFDALTKDGTRMMGIIESNEPIALALELHEQFGVPKRLMEANPEKGRVEIASWLLSELVRELTEKMFIIEEYPTADRLEVERERVGLTRR